MDESAQLCAVPGPCTVNRRDDCRYLRLLAWITDYIYTVTVVNGCPVKTTHSPACLAVTGYSIEEYAANPGLWIEMIHPADRAAVMAQASTALAGHTPAPVEHRIIRKDGCLRWLRNAIVLQEDSTGHVTGYDGVITDVTDRKLAEDALRTSEQRLQSILDNSPTVIFVKDTAGHYLLVNRQYLTLFDHTNPTVIGRTDYDLFPQPLADVYRANDRQVLTAKAPREFEEQAPQPDGLHAYLAVKFPLVDAAGAPTAIGCIATDITERKRLERRLQEASDREQSRIGQELHDGLTQSLIAMGYLANVLKHDLQARAAPEARQANDLAALIDQAISQTRQFARGLYPARLETGDLESALHDLAGHMGDLYGVRIELHVTQPARIANRDVASNLYRIAQQAVANSVLHGHATQIDISLAMENGYVMLQVADNGIGLPEPLPATPGLGIHIMRYRAQSIGGIFEIKRQPQGGTLVNCRLKLAQ